MKPTNLKPGSVSHTLLEALRGYPSGVTVAKLVRATRLDQQTVTRRINDLVKGGHACSTEHRPKLFGVIGTEFAQFDQAQLDAQCDTAAARLRAALRRNGPMSAQAAAKSCGVDDGYALAALKKAMRDGTVLRDESVMPRIWYLPEQWERKSKHAMPTTKFDVSGIARKPDPMRIAQSQRGQFTQITTTTKMVRGIKVTTAVGGTDFRHTVRPCDVQPFFSAGKRLEPRAWVGAMLDGRGG